jgi:hypothetical protein
MTLMAALEATINFPLPANSLEKALINAELTPADNYSKKDERGIDLCAAGLLFVLFTTGDEKEADYSLTLPSAEKIKIAYSFLCKKWGEPDLLEIPEPTIDGIQPW